MERNIRNPALHAAETGSPRRSPANSPDADAKGHPEATFSQKVKRSGIGTENQYRSRNIPAIRK